VVNHRARRFGASKYGVTRSSRAARPADRPLPDPVRPATAPRHGGARPGLAGAGRLGLVYMAVLWLAGERPIGTRRSCSTRGHAGGGDPTGQPRHPGRVGHPYNIRAEDTYSVAETPRGEGRSGSATTRHPRAPRSEVIRWTVGPRARPRLDPPSDETLSWTIPRGLPGAEPGPTLRGDARHRVATAQALGITLKAPDQMGANDISRWCTVWSLLERGPT
jgi:hypothetical protein